MRIRSSVAVAAIAVAAGCVPPQPFSTGGGSGTYDLVVAGTTEAAPARRPRSATRLRVIGTNDFHGALEPRPDNTGKRRGGAAYLATAIHNAAAGCVAPACETMLLDGGDEFQGTPASNLAFGRPVVAMFNQLGLAASALGNHDFDWTQDTWRAQDRRDWRGVAADTQRDARVERGRPSLPRAGANRG